MAIDDPEPIPRRVLYHFHKIHPDFGAAVAKGLGLDQHAELEAAE